MRRSPVRGLHFPVAGLIERSANDRGGGRAFRRPGDGRARHHHQPIAQKGAPDKALVRGRIDADDEVIAFLDHVDRPVFGGHFEPDLGEAGGEPGGELSHRDLREQQGRADPQSPARRVSAGSDGSRRLVELGEQCARPLMERAALLGQLEHARAALEQPHVEAGLQLRDPAGQGGLGAPGGARGASKSAVPGDEIEIGEGEQVHVFHQ